MPTSNYAAISANPSLRVYGCVELLIQSRGEAGGGTRLHSYGTKHDTYMRGLQEKGACDKDFWIDVLLTILGWLPGYALLPSDASIPAMQHLAAMPFAETSSQPRNQLSYSTNVSHHELGQPKLTDHSYIPLTMC